MFVISHVSMYLPWIYPRVLAGRFEERIAVLIDLQLLLELTTPKARAPQRLFVVMYMTILISN